MPIRLATICSFILCLTILAEDAPKPTAPPEPAGMKSIFNGKDLDGWEGDMRLWSVKDGLLRGETTKEQPTKGNTFLIWKGGDLKDFELRLSFKIDHGNSGIQYRSKLVPPKPDAENKWVVAGYQAEVENTPGKAGFLYHERGRGYLNNVGDKVEMLPAADAKSKPEAKVVGKLGDKEAIGKTYKKSDWNDYVIIAKGNHIEQYLNGIQTVDFTDKDEKGRCDSGILALQLHAGAPMVVEFKDIRIKMEP